MPNAFEINSGGFHLRSRLLPVVTGKVLPVLFLTIITILYSRKLSYTDYGLFQTIWVYANIISVVISFGLSSVILSGNFDYFIYFIQSNLRKILACYSAGSIITFGIFYFNANDFSSATRLLLIVFIILQNAGTLTDTLLIKKNQLGFYLLMNLIFSLLFFLIHLYFYFQPFILNHLVLCIIFLSAAKAACIFFVKKELALKYDLQTKRSFGDNWFFIGINEITGIIARWLDKLFLLYLLTPAAFAVFFNGAIEIPLFGILISAIETIMLNNIAANLKDKKNAVQTFRESFKILSLIAFPLFFFLLVSHAELFAILFNNRYNASIPVFLVSIFIIPVRISHYGVLLQCYGQAHKITIGAVLDIVFSLLLMIILYPLLGTPGVALAIVISTYLQAGYYLWQSSRVMQVNIFTLLPGYFLRKALMALSLLYGLLYYVKPYFSSLISLIVIFAITSIIIITGLIFFWNSDKPAQHISPS